MQHTLILNTFTTGVFLFLTACTPSSRHEMFRPKSGYQYSGIYFGKHLSPLLKRGIDDGCETAKGFYTKSHTLFNNEIDYYNGWFLGRNKCRHLLKLDENGDLIK